MNRLGREERIVGSSKNCYGNEHRREKTKEEVSEYDRGRREELCACRMWEIGPNEGFRTKVADPK